MQGKAPCARGPLSYTTGGGGGRVGSDTSSWRKMSRNSSLFRQNQESMCPYFLSSTQNPLRTSGRTGLTKPSWMHHLVQEKTSLLDQGLNPQGSSAPRPSSCRSGAS